MSHERLIIVVDPMLATGNSSIAAIDKLKERGATTSASSCLLAAPEGITQLPRRPSGRAGLSRPRSTAT